MTSLTMMDLTLGILVRAIFLFALKNPLVVLTTPLLVLMIPLIVFVVWLMNFFPIGIKSIGNVVLLVVFVPIGVKSKGDQITEIFLRPKSWFSLQFWKSVL